MSTLKANKWKTVDGFGQGSVTVGNIGDLSQVDIGPLKKGDIIHVMEYHDGYGFGGGSFWWDDERPRSEHNGGTVISPSVPFSGIHSMGEYIDGDGEADPSANGCWVRIYDGLCDLRYFGAVGDVSQNATDIIQQAIYTDSVFMPKGIYKISKTIRIPSNRTLQGIGFETEIYADTSWLDNEDHITNTSTEVDSPANENIRVSDFKINGNFSTRNSGASGLSFVNTSNLFIKGIFAEDCRKHGINITSTKHGNTSETEYVDQGCKDVIITECVSTRHGDDGITTHWCHNVTISKCICYGTVGGAGNSWGIEIDDGSLLVTVVDNICYDNAVGNIIIKGHDTPVGAQIIVANNILHGDCRGIFARGRHSSKPPGLGPTAKDIVISDNLIEGCQGDAIQVHGYKNITVKGNLIKGGSGGRASIDISYGCQNGVVSGNVIVDHDSNYGIRLDERGSDDPMYGFVVDGNYVRNTKRGIRITSDTVATGNIVTAGPNQETFGLIVFCEQGRFVNIHNNSVLGWTSDNYRDETEGGAIKRLSGNIGFHSNTGTLVYLTSSFFVDAGVFTNIEWGDAVYDELGMFDPNNPSLLTVPAGVHKVRVGFSRLVDNYGDIDETITRVQVNGSNVVGAPVEDSRGGDLRSIVQSSAIIPVSEGDIITLQARTVGGDGEYSSNQTWLSVELI